MSASRTAALLDPRLHGVAVDAALDSVDLDYPVILAVEPEPRPVLPGLTVTVYGLVEPQLN
jgi:hypothetical protein